MNPKHIVMSVASVALLVLVATPVRATAGCSGSDQENLVDCLTQKILSVTGDPTDTVCQPGSYLTSVCLLVDRETNLVLGMLTTSDSCTPQTEPISGACATAYAAASVDQWDYCSSDPYPGAPNDCAYGVAGGGGHSPIDGGHADQTASSSKTPSATSSCTWVAGGRCTIKTLEEDDQLVYGQQYLIGVSSTAYGNSPCAWSCASTIGASAVYYSHA